LRKLVFFDLCLSVCRSTLLLLYPPTEDLYKKPKEDEDGKEDEFVKLDGGFLKLWSQDVLSASASARVRDYFQNFFIGLFELAIYPPLIAHMDLAPIGAWITLKTVAQWGEWKTDRGTFNRFLIGNALVITAAIWLATMVHVTPDTASGLYAPG
jgi:hypothetical protein